MHSRIIFIIDTERHFQTAGELYSPPWDESDMAGWIPGCDYVVKSDDFEADCKWFGDMYNLDGRMSTKEVVSLGEKRLVYEIEIDALIASLMENEKRRIEKIKEELAKENPDLWIIQHLAWNSGFWFAIVNGAFEPEMGLLRFLRSFKEEGVEKIWIVGSYDYHI